MNTIQWRGGGGGGKGAVRGVDRKVLCRGVLHLGNGIGQGPAMLFAAGKG